MNLLLRLLGVAACLSGLACHHHHRQGPPRFEQSCTSGCERAHACDESVDVAECYDACLKSYAPYGEHLRKEYLEEVDQCIEDARCSDLGVTALDNSCRRDARDRIGANLKAVELCDVVTETLSICSGARSPLETQQTSDTCVQSMKIFDDATLEDATDCGNESCTELGKCFTAVLGFTPPIQPSVANDAASKR